MHIEIPPFKSSQTVQNPFIEELQCLERKFEFIRRYSIRNDIIRLQNIQDCKN